jgi:adenylate cyclase class 2
MLEIEVKIRVADVSQAREKLLTLGAALEKERYSEENTLYDFASQSLKKKEQALRLREAGKKAFLTFKGSPRKSRRFKMREEYETEVKKIKPMKKILKSLGLDPAVAYRKQRTLFRKGRLKICLDETSAGNFIELEGERNKIMNFVRLWGASKSELIKQDYVQLIKEARAKKTAESR